MKLIRKMTIKSCGDFTIKRIQTLLQDAAGYEEKDGKTVAKEVADGTTVQLLRIAGEAARAETGQTDKGTFTRLSGQFVGTDLTSGEIYQSGQCILPEWVSAQLSAALLSAGAQTVQFAFEIGAKAKANAITGYEFTVTPIGDVRPTETATRLLAMMGVAAPALSAPAAAAGAAAEAPAAAPAPAPAPAAAKGAKK